MKSQKSQEIVENTKVLRERCTVCPWFSLELSFKVRSLREVALDSASIKGLGSEQPPCGHPGRGYLPCILLGVKHFSERCWVDCNLFGGAPKISCLLFLILEPAAVTALF